MLARIQNELFDLGADLATPGEDFAPSEMALRIVPEQIDRLEREIDRMNEDLAPLRSFILPGRRGRRGPAPSRPGGGAAGRALGGRGRGARSTRWRSPISTGFRTICSCWRVGWRARMAGIFSGSPARPR